MTQVTCRLTAKNRDQLRNPTLGNRVWATFTFAFVCVYVNQATHVKLVLMNENDDDEEEEEEEDEDDGWQQLYHTNHATSFVLATGEESVRKIITNNTINVFLKLQSAFW